MSNEDVVSPPADHSSQTKCQIIKHSEVCKKLRVSGSKLHDMRAKGDFPKAFIIIPNGRAAGWLEHEVDEWILNRRHRSMDDVCCAPVDLKSLGAKL